MGLFDFFSRKANDLASKNADAHLRSLGFNVANLSMDIQAIAYRDMCNANFIVRESGGRPLTVAECALCKLASIYVSRRGNPEIAHAIALTIPNIAGNGAGSVRKEIAEHAHELMSALG